MNMTFVNIDAWRLYIRQHRTECAVTIGALILTLGSYARFLSDVESRTGVVLNDPVHALVGPFNFTWPIFILLYGALVITLVALRSQPEAMFRALRGYLIVVSVRILMMWATPFDPPATMIPLDDPFVALFAGNGVTLTRDLMFSGHTSLLCLAALCLPQRKLRIALGFAALAVGAMVITQHVHYTIDVLVAPFVAYAARR